MPTLNRPQARFLALREPYRAYVAGFGSGKTWALAASQAKHVLEYPRVPLGYYAPTYPAIRDIWFPTVEEVAADWGMRTKINEANKEVHWYAGNRYYGTTICRSMEKPDGIVGFKVGRGSVDELDTLPMRKAQNAWRKIIARNRVTFGGQNGADVGTTPEGFRFTWNQWVKQVRENPALAGKYALVHAATRDNRKFLPSDYIDNLMASYPAGLISAYLEGQFVNLTAGTVYHAYDRVKNRSLHTVQPSEPVKIGMDFNVGKMAAVTHVLRDGNPHAVDELMGGYDTPDMIAKIRTRYWDYRDGDWHRTREITIYPDASGDSRKSVGASASDIDLLKAAGFKVKAPRANPPVKDRINAMNALLCNGAGERRYFVNDQSCPSYAEGLEQQAWTDSGEPDKASGHDHGNDAAGYYIHSEFPIARRPISLNIGFAR